ncbi:Diphthamide biosynthesis protein 2 [Blomia tropicalis]|nr:Diphthamide biosynthesis protein 2 [Blomia tropicalis]
MNIERFDLRECAEWLISKRLTNVCLYFLPQFYCLSSEITVRLKSICSEINFYVMISCSSSVDAVKYRVDDNSSPDGVIYFGATCLCSSKYSTELPILFVPLLKDDNEVDYVIECIMNQINDGSNRKLLLSDLTNSYILKNETIANLLSKTRIDIALFANTEDRKNWHFTSKCMSLFDDGSIISHQQSTVCHYSPHIITNELSHYEAVIFVGQCENLELMINCKKLIIIDPQNRSMQTLDGAREFRKRVSLIEKFKRQSVNLIGMVYLNYTKSITPIMEQTKLYCKRLKKIPYYLTLNQNDFEARLGNFGQLESFVMINSCECNWEIANSTCKYLYPVIFWKEFLIAASERITYGGIEWNVESTTEYENEDCTEESGDERNMEIIERDLFKRPDGWFGLVVDAGAKQVSDIKQGMSGIPSSYINEEELF